MKYVIIVVGLVAGCSSAVTSHVYSSQRSDTLWYQHSLERNLLKLAQIEAELGSRGEYSSGTFNFIGRRTAELVGRERFERSSSGVQRRNDRNCDDFATAAEAQKFFLSSGGPTADPHRLDGDGDGFACEWGREVKRAYRKFHHTPKVRAYRSAPRCYTGPRGGRYTISAGGRKNYGGC
ncbi:MULTISPECIES: excalibur calcium-binding domain-containing protein [unclassified Phaeobacter]|uniref:excalibur calcium-binding domain-containing protein n=1 Tax=unclassified Phaeobacter TaxID=2621772 RepID=UPI003A839E30